MMSMLLFRERATGEVWTETQQSMTADARTLLQQDRGEERSVTGLELLELFDQIRPHGPHHSPCRHPDVRVEILPK